MAAQSIMQDFGDPLEGVGTCQDGSLYLEAQGTLCDQIQQGTMGLIMWSHRGHWLTKSLTIQV